MNQTSDKLINDLNMQLSDDEKIFCGQIMDFLTQLGYVPEKQRVKGYVLSFRHIQNGRVIAKIGTRGSKQKATISLKFFGCKTVPLKYSDALRAEIESHNGQYCGPLRDNVIKNRCGFCKQCTGGGVAYYYAYPDGREILRCGAYPILIPDLTLNDIDDMKKVLMEQHEYFLTIK